MKRQCSQLCISLALLMLSLACIAQGVANDDAAESITARQVPNSMLIGLADPSAYPPEHQALLSAVKVHVEGLRRDASTLIAHAYCGEKYCFVDVYPRALADDRSRFLDGSCETNYCATLMYSAVGLRMLNVRLWR